VCQAVEVGRVNHAVAAGAQTVRAMLVRHQEENMGTRNRGRLWPERRNRRGHTAYLEVRFYASWQIHEALKAIFA